MTRPAGVAASPLPPACASCRPASTATASSRRSHDIADRTAAEALRGARIFVSRPSFPTRRPDEFYWVDLIGLAVVNRDGVALGEVVGLIDTGPHSVLRVVAPPAPGGDAGERRPSG